MVRNQMIYPLCKVVVERDHLARGFELLKGNYVQITEERSLFGTSKGAEKPYRLVAETLDKTGRVAIAQTVFHENEASSLFAPCETV